jgi:transposase
VTSDRKAPSPRLASIDRSQLVLRTVDVERLIEDDHSVRSIWELVGRLDLSLYHAQIEAVEGHAGRDHTDPQLLISLWLYAYSRGVSSAREVARQCEFAPAFQWLCGLRAISHRTSSGFRSENKAALDDLFVQVLGMLSAEGLITLERVTLDGTKIKANAGGNTFRRKERLQAHLELARAARMLSSTFAYPGWGGMVGQSLRLQLLDWGLSPNGSVRFAGLLLAYSYRFSPPPSPNW